VSAVLDYPHRYAFTADEYFRMGEAGVFPPEARVELIEGEIVEMAPIGSPHAGTVNILTRAFVLLAGDRAIVSVQNPLIVSDRSVPQPDVAVLGARATSYTDAHPTAADVFLVVEVSDTTARFDRSIKVPLYARAGIQEAWVVDVNAKVVHVYREPEAGGYRTTRTVAVGGEVALRALPDVRIAVGDLFPEATRPL
jgi:Uma2 family endonuclease